MTRPLSEIFFSDKGLFYWFDEDLRVEISGTNEGEQDE